MDIDAAFDELQRQVNVLDGDLKEARRQRALFSQAFGDEPDTTEDVVSGSLAREVRQTLG